MIIVLKSGKVAEQGSHETLMQIENGVYRRLWEAQLSENTQDIPKESDSLKEEREEGMIVDTANVKVGK